MQACGRLSESAKKLSQPTFMGYLKEGHIRAAMCRFKCSGRLKVARHVEQQCSDAIFSILACLDSGDSVSCHLRRRLKERMRKDAIMRGSGAEVRAEGRLSVGRGTEDNLGIRTLDRNPFKLRLSRSL